MIGKVIVTLTLETEDLTTSLAWAEALTDAEESERPNLQFSIQVVNAIGEPTTLENTGWGLRPQKTSPSR